MPPQAKAVRRKDAVLRADVPQDAFIYGTADRELETRVVSVTHIGEILMRKQFQQHGRGTWDAGFVIGAIP